MVLMIAHQREKEQELFLTVEFHEALMKETHQHQPQPKQGLKVRFHFSACAEPFKKKMMSWLKVN